MHPGTRVLTGGDGQRFTFDAGSLSIELMASGGPGAYQKWEVLHSPEDLQAWLADSRLAPLPELLLEKPDLGRIKHLRDTLWSIAPAIANGDPVQAADIETINGYAMAPPPRPRVDPSGLTLGWAMPVTGGQVLGAFAHDALEVIGSEHLRSRLRECSGDNCKLIFLDTSRPGNRRWCSMDRCGNRNKVRSHRARRSLG